MSFLQAFVLLVTISQVWCQNSPIAFTVGQDAHLDHLQLATDTAVPYNLVITSSGSPNLNNGVFTCTRAGLYKFQAYALTRSGSNVYLEVYQNTNLVASLWGHTTGDYAAAGNVVILPLMVGDTVEIKVKGDYEVHIYGQPDEIYTTFTGVQLGSREHGNEGSQLSAFSVTLNQTTTVQAGAPVLFNKVLVDTNNGYDQASGIYTAPTGGLYVFHIFSLSEADEEEWEELYRNDQYICAIYGSSSSEYADAGNTVLLHLNTGDQVSLRSNRHTVSTIYGAGDELYATFSGAQIATDNDLSTDSGFFGFSAGLSQHYAANNGTNVVFNQVFFDDVNVYDPTTGTFTASVAGLYEFNYHALGEQHNEVYLDLYKNNVYVNSLYSHIPNSWATAGNAAVLDLSVGDTVTVRANGAQLLFGDPKEIYCTFTGYLLAPTTGGVPVGK